MFHETAAPGKKLSILPHPVDRQYFAAARQQNFEYSSTCCRHLHNRCCWGTQHHIPGIPTPLCQPVILYNTPGSLHQKNVRFLKVRLIQALFPNYPKQVIGQAG